MATERVKCAICDNMILLATAHANDGLCAQCVKIPPAKRDIEAAVYADTNPLEQAIELYLSLIDSLAEQSTSRNIGGISDPAFEGVRFYALESVGGSFNFDEAMEVGSEAVDEIEHYLLAVKSGFSLLSPIATKLRSISSSFNANGKTVFLGSWGMGPEEIAWLIRFLNDRPTFVRHLQETGITEQEVDVFNETYAKELNEAEH